MLRQVLLDGQMNGWKTDHYLIILKFAYKNNEFEYNVIFTIKKKGVCTVLISSKYVLVKTYFKAM